MNAGPATILVVDDQRSNRVLIGTILEQAGYRVLLAEGGAPALAVFGTEKPDLVLLDFVMPGLNGPAVARALRARRGLRDLPIILLTSSAREEDIEAAFESGANDYLTKPVDRRILLARVRSTLQASDDRRRAAGACQVVAERDALRVELAEAQRVQRSLLPHVPFSDGTWRITGTVVPCGQIGGDAFDMVHGQGDANVILLFDVSGHGIAAALMAASISSQLRSLLPDRPLTDALGILNDRLFAGSAGKYACIAALELKGEHAILVNAGLPPVSIVRNGRIEQTIEATATPLGLVQHAPIEAERIFLGPHDRLVFMSDGLTEPFGTPDAISPSMDRLGLFATDRALPDPDELAGRVRALFGVDELQDDATLLVVDRLATAGLAAEATA